MTRQIAKTAQRLTPCGRVVVSGLGGLPLTLTLTLTRPGRRRR